MATTDISEKGLESLIVATLIGYTGEAVLPAGAVGEETTPYTAA
jgi:hypothetical protein